MAFILAINPAGGHTATLTNVARDLKAHELVGADSHSVAVTAVRQRPPDLILLPSSPHPDEQDLFSAIRWVPGGVRLLRLPPTEAADPRTLIKEIRDLLAKPAAKWAEAVASVEKPWGSGSAHLIAAGVALAKWIRARRVLWAANEAVPVEVAAQPPPAPAKSARKTPAAGTIATPRPRVTRTDFEDEDDIPPREEERVQRRAEPSSMSRVADAASSAGESIRRVVPYLTAAVIGVGVLGGAVYYWPKVQSAVTNGSLVLESVPPGAQVYIDGQAVGVTPTTATLAAGPHHVEFRAGDVTRAKDVVIAARQQITERVDWNAAPTGTLDVSSDPSGARVLVDGKYRGTTPLALDNLPAGNHVVVLETPSGTVRRTVRITAGETQRLIESLVAGWVAVFAPFEVQLSEGRRLLTVDDRGRTLLPPGPHTIRIQNRTLGYDEIRNVEVKPSETTALNLTPQTGITITSSEPADVLIDGTRVGSTPLRNHRVPLGTHNVVVRSSSGREKQMTVEATPKPLQLNVDLSAP